MKPEEAIEVLQHEKERVFNHANPKRRNALDLGIEALKFYLESSHYACGCLLPGETHVKGKKD